MVTEYPWEGEFDKEKCNSDESGIGKTSRVDRYPNGVSPYGCYDMVGNVWEWTSEWHDYVEDSLVLRGGFWRYNYDHDDYRCAYRDSWSTPDVRGRSIGFRCARTLTL